MRKESSKKTKTELQDPDRHPAHGNDENPAAGIAACGRDITEREQAEEALLKARDELENRVEERTAALKSAVEALSTERHRIYDVLEALPVYVCLLDKDYRMPFANRYFRETFREPQGRRCYDFLFNRSEPCEICESYTVMKTRAPHHWFWTGPNGRDYDIYDFPFTDSDGSFMILEMGTDITERKKAEEALHKANAYNRSLIEASPDPLLTINPDGTISDVNEATIRITGFSRRELIGTDFSDYFTEPVKAKAGYEKVFRDGSVTDYVLEIRHRNGQVTSVLYNATVYRDTAGNVIGVFAAARDITERKKAEDAIKKAHDLLEIRVKERTSELVQSNARLRTEIEERGKAERTLRETSQYLENLINYANAPIIVWDPEFRITLFNHAFEHLTDRTAAEVIGKPLDILLPSGCMKKVMDLIRKTLEGERWESVELPILHKKGGIRTVLWNSASIFGADGKTIVSIIAQGQDITDRKKIESEYRLRASEYAKMNVALEEEIRQREITDTTLKKTLSLLNASLESTADGIYVVDQQGTITGYNH
jgi:PAS domain S-box-containing protein